MLVEEIWNKVVDMINEIKFNTDMIVEKSKINILDEYAKCT